MESSRPRSRSISAPLRSGSYDQEQVDEFDQFAFFEEDGDDGGREWSRGPHTKEPPPTAVALIASCLVSVVAVTTLVVVAFVVHLGHFGLCLCLDVTEFLILRIVEGRQDAPPSSAEDTIKTQ